MVRLLFVSGKWLLFLPPHQNVESTFSPDALHIFALDGQPLKEVFPHLVEGGIQNPEQEQVAAIFQHGRHTSRYLLVRREVNGGGFETQARRDDVKLWKEGRFQWLVLKNVNV